MFRIGAETTQYLKIGSLFQESDMQVVSGLELPQQGLAIDGNQQTYHLNQAGCSKLIYGADQSVCEFVSYHIFNDFYRFGKDARAIGIMINDKIVAGVVYDDLCLDLDGRPYSMESSIAAIDKRWCTKHNLRALFSYPFIQLKLDRLTVNCHSDNKGSQMFVTKLGFKKEGYHPKAWPGGGDLVSFGMIREDCRWING